jgi:endonuclease/exonuclease/phosphatase family metal-dependent hydrolase
MVGGMTRLQIISWNVNRLPSETALGALRPSSDKLDVILLQEVTNTSLEGYRQGLESLGFKDVVPRDSTPGTKNYGNVIASRHKLVAVPPPRDVSYPELLLHARLELPASRSLHVVCVHAPNGSNNGWEKIHTLRGARTIVTSVGDEPVVVAGDFNEPRYLMGSPVRSRAWEPDRDWEDLRHRSWPRKNARGVEESEPRENWDEAVRWFFDEKSGLQHAHWATHGVGTIHASHRTTSAVAPERWFDHLFLSKSGRVIDSAYRDELCTPQGPSDHSGFWAEIEV